MTLKQGAKSCFKYVIVSTVKLGNKERFDKEQISIKEPFPVTNLPFTYKDKELLALRNNFRATKKFLIAKFDCTSFRYPLSARIRFP